MSKMFSNLKADAGEKQEDRVGSGFEPFASNVYDATIKLAYAGASASGARNVTLHFDINGKELRETIYVTNRNGENTFPDRDNPGKNILLPGFSMVDDICLFASEIHLTDQDTETKTIKLYNPTERKEMNTEVPMLMALLGKPVKLAVLEIDEPVQEKGPDGAYRDTDKRRRRNEIDKAMHPETGRTINEYKRETDEPEYMNAWLTKNKDQVRVKNGAKTGAAGASGTGSPFGGEKKVSGLFSKKS